MIELPLKFYALTGLINFITATILAIVVIRNNPKATINRLFFVFSLLVGWWSFFYFMWLNASSARLAELYMRICMLTVIFMPTVFFHFISALIKQNIDRNYLIINYLISFAFFLTIFTPLYATGVSRVMVFPYWLIPGPVFHFALAHFFVLIFYSFYLIARALKRSKGIFKNQLLYIFIGTAIGYASGSTNYFAWYRIPVPPILNIFVALYVIFIAYAIVKHRLWDIRLLVLKSVAYSLTLMLVGGAYFTIFLLGISKLSEAQVMSPLILNTITLVFLSLSFSFIRKFFTKATNKLFAKSLYDFKDLMGQLTEITKINSRSIASLTSELMQALIKNMNVSRAAFVLAEGGQFSEIKALGFGTSYRTWEKPVNVALKANETVACDEIEEGEAEKEVLRNAQVQVLIPIKTEERCEAVLALGEKKSGDMYTAQDLNLLELIAPQIALTLENARLYEQATTDALTGLYHQKYFQVRLNSELERSKRFGYPLSLIMLDIDFFKDINDKCGHQAGDKVLIELTKLIKDNVRSYDVVGRYGGDEFVMLLPVVNKGDAGSHKETAKQIANRLRKVIGDHSFTDMDLKVQVSLGIVICDGKTAPNCDCLIEKADQLLYKAKNSGRNTVCIESLKSKEVA